LAHRFIQRAELISSAAPNIAIREQQHEMLAINFPVQLDRKRSSRAPQLAFAAVSFADVSVSHTSASCAIMGLTS
jgi:hypothetical protein